MTKFIVAIVIIAISAFVIYRMQENKKIAAESKKKGAEFLVKNKSQAGVIETSTGLQYLISSAVESGETPQSNSRVKVHYHGTLIDGSVFDSSVERGQPITFGLNQVIPGWTEGLQLMKKGEKFRFFIPPELGYGNRGAGAIPPGSVLIFDVELLDFF